MTRWEYFIVECDMSAPSTPLSQLFSNFGSVGWELVATRPVVTSVGSDWQWLAIFKRPVAIPGKGE
jgi:hypothetical protein